MKKYSVIKYVLCAILICGFVLQGTSVAVFASDSKYAPKSGMLSDNGLTYEELEADLFLNTNSCQWILDRLKSINQWPSEKLLAAADKTGLQIGLGLNTTVHAVTDPTILFDKNLDEYDYYKAILISLFLEDESKYDLTSDEFDDFKDTATSDKTTIQSLQKYVDLTEKTSELPDTDLNKIKDEIKKTIFKDVKHPVTDFIDYAFKAVDTVIDVIQLSQEFADLCEASQESKLLIDELKSGTKDDNLLSALEEIGVAMDDFTDGVAEIICDEATEIAMEALKKALKKAYTDALYDVLPVELYLALQLGTIAGDTITSLLFDNSSMEDSLNKLECIGVLGRVLINATDRLGQQYLDSKNSGDAVKRQENARLYIHSIEILFRLRELSCDYSETFADNALDATTVEKLFRLFDSDKNASYKDFLDKLASDKQNVLDDELQMRRMPLYELEFMYPDEYASRTYGGLSVEEYIKKLEDDYQKLIDAVPDKYVADSLIATSSVSTNSNNKNNNTSIPSNSNKTQSKEDNSNTSQTRRESAADEPDADYKSEYPDSLFDDFLYNEIPAYDQNGNAFYFDDLQDEKNGIFYAVGPRVDIDNDGEDELVLTGGFYGGMFLDAENGKIRVFEQGYGTGAVLGYGYYENQWLVCHKDTSHAGRNTYSFKVYQGADTVADSFVLSADYWDAPDPNHYDENSTFTFKDQSITMEEYENLLREIFSKSDPSYARIQQRVNAEPDPSAQTENATATKGDLSRLLTGHYWSCGIQAPGVADFYDDGTCEQYAYAPDGKLYDENYVFVFEAGRCYTCATGTYKLNGNELTVYWDYEGVPRTNTYLFHDAGDPDPEETGYDVASYIASLYGGSSYFYEKGYEPDSMGDPLASPPEYLGLLAEKTNTGTTGSNINTNTDNIIKTGNYVTFGTYEQDNNPDNGKEPVEWRVLAVDGDQCLLISRYALTRDFYSFNEKYTTWETSDIRAWLNSEFISEAFTQTEQSCLVETLVKNSNTIDGGNDTIDRVFLLSADEARMYFSSDYDRRCAQSAYSIKKEVLPYFGSDYSTSSGEPTVWWWLRTTVEDGRCAVGVKPDGDLFMGGGYCNTSQAIRPALWTKINGIEAGIPSEGIAEQEAQKDSILAEFRNNDFTFPQDSSGLQGNMVSAYADVVRDYEAKYGKLEFQKTDYGLTSYTGVFLIRFLDFDQDGAAEMLIGHASRFVDPQVGETYLSIPAFDIWTMENETPVQVCEGINITTGSVDRYCEYIIWQGRYGIVTGWAGYNPHLVIQAFEDSSFHEILDIQEEYTGTVYQWIVNGVVMSEEEGNEIYRSIENNAAAYYGTVRTREGESEDSIRADLEEAYKQLGLQLGENNNSQYINNTVEGIQPDNIVFSELTIEDFLGSYMDMDPDRMVPGFSDPSLLDLYYDQGGQLTGFLRTFEEAPETMFYYLYKDYKIDGDQIELYYEEIVNPYYGSEYAPGTHRFNYADGNLQEILPGGFEHILYRIE